MKNPRPARESQATVTQSHNSGIPKFEVLILNQYFEFWFWQF